MLLHHLKSKADGKSASMAIIWCLSPEQIERLKREDKEPKIVISVLHIKRRGDDRYPRFEFEEENRKIVPVTAVSTFVTFRNPGQHIICAGIKDGDYEDKDLLKIYRRDHGYNDYFRSIVDVKADFYDSGKTENVYMDSSYLLAKDDFATLEVNVDERHFAPQPRDYKLVNSWFDTKPTDQCHHRKRRILAYFLTFAILPLTQFGKIILFFLNNIIVGTTLINWRSIFRPFTYGAFCDKNYWKVVKYLDKDGQVQTKKWWKILLNWRLLVLYGLLIRTIIIFSSFFLTYLIPILTVFGCLGAVSALITAIVLLDKKYEDKIKTWLEIQIRKSEERGEKKAELLKLEQDQELETMACSLLPQEISYATLPSKKKTIYLRFQNIKAQVCRPFAGS